MENLILSLNTVVPLFLLMMLGYFLKRIKLMPESILTQLNKLVFNVFLAASLFYNIYTTKLEDAWSTNAVVYIVVSVVLIFLLLLLIVPRFEKDKRKASVMIQSVYRSNIIVLGIPIVNELCGEGNGGLMSIIIALVIPMYNIISIFIFAFMGEDKPKISATLLKIAKNPLIIGSLLGILFITTGLKLPYILEKSVSSVASVSTPLALIVLGGFFDFKKLSGNVKQLVFSISARLVFVPLIFLGTAVFLGFRDSDLITMLATFCSPSAVTSFTMAKQMGADADLAAQTVVLGTLFSIATMFLWIFSLKQFGLF